MASSVSQARPPADDSGEDSAPDETRISSSRPSKCRRPGANSSRWLPPGRPSANSVLNGSRIAPTSNLHRFGRSRSHGGCTSSRAGDEFRCPQFDIATFRRGSRRSAPAAVQVRFFGRRSAGVHPRHRGRRSAHPGQPRSRREVAPQGSATTCVPQPRPGVLACDRCWRATPSRARSRLLRSAMGRGDRAATAGRGPGATKTQRQPQCRGSRRPDRGRDTEDPQATLGAPAVEPVRPLTRLTQDKQP